MQMGNKRRVWALLAATCVLLAACTAKSATDAGGSGTTTAGAGGSAGSTVGITATTITVSMISADLSQLSSQHLAPEIGNADKTMKAVVADINAHGGVAGRKIILISHVLHGTDAILNPDLGRQACVQATEDDKPFAVILTASLPAAMVQCVAADHNVLTITMDSWPDSLYAAAKGRLFSLASHISIGQNAEYRAWPGVLDGAGLLKGKKIGIIRQDLADQQEVTDDALVPGIKALGYNVAAQAVLPCPEGSQTCEQQTVAIQRMEDAGVNVVFLVAQTLAGSATVQAAQTLGYKPQWMTVGNNVTDTVAKFYANAKQNYDGAYGLAIAFADLTPAAATCNQIAVAGGAQKFPEESDGYGFTAVTCIQMQSLAQAIKAVDGPVGQTSVSAALEQLKPVLMMDGPPGSITKQKHYSGTSVYLSRYSAATQTFKPVDNQKPILIVP
jgi:ABC-type branched-subunit amino acid transport system substrate-binding protein